jgi:maltooligosyltrehalose trehalohydrolase
MTMMNDDLPPQGAVVSRQGVNYRIWAPQVSAMAVEIFSATGKMLRQVPMAEEEKGGYFQGTDSEGRAGDRYKYRPNGGQCLPDPASRWQPEGVHGASMVIDPSTYSWTDEEWQ